MCKSIYILYTEDFDFVSLLRYFFINSMALVESENFDIGKQAPNFQLINAANDKIVKLLDIKGEKGTAIFFICNHCPYVVHINEELIKLADDYLPKGIGFVAISSNDSENYPQDGKIYMKQTAEKLGYPFPYLYDETQQVALSYKAVCTPDLYLFDKNLKSVYHGQLDDSRPGNKKPLTGKDFRNAIDCLLEDKLNKYPQSPSIGCSIKWKR